LGGRKSAASRRTPKLAGEGEDEEVAFAGGDDAEETAAGGDSEIAEGDAVEDGQWRWLKDGNICAGLLSGERGNGNPGDVGGFSLGSALEQNAILAGRPLECAEAHSEASKMIGRGKVADFEDFAVDEVGDFFAAG
jgi:hypothetical protein